MKEITQINNVLKVTGAKNFYDGARIEFEYLDRYFTKLKLKWKRVFFDYDYKKGRVYDNMIIKDEKSRFYHFVFDSTDFFGKW